MAGTVTILPQDRKISVLIESFSIFFSSFFLFLNFAFSHFVYSYYCISALLLSSNFALPHFAGFDISGLTYIQCQVRVSLSDASLRETFISDSLVLNCQSMSMTCWLSGNVRLISGYCQSVHRQSSADNFVLGSGMVTTSHQEHMDYI